MINIYEAQNSFKILAGGSVCYSTCIQNRSTQRAVLQNSYSTEGILLRKLIQFYVLLARWNTSAGRLFKRLLVSRRKFFQNFGQSLKICWNYECSWWNTHNSLMLRSWLGKPLVLSSWERRTPFNLPGKAVMRWQASSLSPGKFQAHCKMFLKVFRWVLPTELYLV